MNKKLILFIDDGDITEVVGKLERSLKKVGITLVWHFLNLKNDKYKKENSENGETILDLDLIKRELQEEYMSKRYDLVACDFNFTDKYLSGFKLTKWLKNVAKAQKEKIRNAKFVLYSSEKEKSLKETFSEDDMGDLIRLKIEDFIDREKLADGLATIINNEDEEIDLLKKLLLELDKFPDLKFKSVYPKFEGKTIKEIIHEIESDSHHGKLFQVMLIEFAVSHMISLNEDE